MHTMPRANDEGTSPAPENIVKVEECLLNKSDQVDASFREQLEPPVSNGDNENKRSNLYELRKGGKSPKWMRLSKIPKRYYVTFLLFLTTVLEGYVLTNLSIVVVDINSNKTVVLENRTEVIVEAEHKWTSVERGVVLGMNSVGQIIVCLAGVAVHRIGGAVYMSIGKFGEALISLTTPYVINTHLYLFIVHRFVLGLFEGLSYTGTMDVLAHWSLPSERMRLSVFVSLGYGIGIAANFPISGFIIQHFGWELVFYIVGILILIWSIVWTIFVSNDPSTDQFILTEEKIYLAQEINFKSRNEISVPYKDILTSIPTYALLNEFFISGFTSSFVMLTPLYIKDIYNVDIQTIGFISCIPEFANLIVRVVSSHFIDKVRLKPNGYGIGKTHKIVLFWGQFFVLVFFFFTALWNGLIISIICLTLARISYGISSNSYYVITIDVAGPFTGFLHSLTQMCRSFTYFLNPVLIGFMIQHHTQTEWNLYFVVVGFLTMYGVIVFIIFGSGDLQPWAGNAYMKNNSQNTNDGHNGVPVSAELG